MRVIKAIDFILDEGEKRLGNTKTYRLNFDKKTIEGHVDNLQALKQHIYKILKTERFRSLIYDSDFGSEIEKIKSAAYLSPALFQSELELAVSEALLVDDRVLKIDDFKMSLDRDVLKLSFTLDTVYGGFEVLGEF